MAEKRDFDEFLEKFHRHHEVMVEELHKVIIGQDAVIDQILAAIFTGGHCLLVGVPGLCGLRAAGDRDRRQRHHRLEDHPRRSRCRQRLQWAVCPG